MTETGCKDCGKDVPLEPGPLERPTDRPVALYDGNCGFCRNSRDRFRALSGDKIAWIPLQYAQRYGIEIPQQELQQSIHLLEPNGDLTRGAEAIFRIMDLGQIRRWPRSIYEFIPLVPNASEIGYRIVARNRPLVTLAARSLCGRPDVPETYQYARRIFLFSLAVVYFIAFFSFFTQAPGLIGSDGILPAADFLQQVDSAYSNSSSPFFVLPTLAWFNSSDIFINIMCILGMALGITAIIGFLPVFCFAAMWILYLSLVNVGQEFFSFQWDILLLETGFLAIFFSPSSWSLYSKRASRPSVIIRWLLWWLLFRLLFLSGLVKLLSGDPTWLEFTALEYHYFTQPLPTWTSWYATHWPHWVQITSTVIMFIIEIGIPFLIFLPRVPRLIAACAITLLMLLIAGTGNYGFFNLLAIVLCLLLVDDSIWRFFSPKRIAKKMSLNLPQREHLLKRGVNFLVLLLVLPLTIAIGINDAARTAGSAYQISIPEAVSPLIRSHVANSYGLFRVMTVRRPELVIEGSQDGLTWKAYSFKWKPGALNRAPAFVEPYMPRLDWQMWFAALNVEQHRIPGWLQAFGKKLSQGSPAVLNLLDSNPFPEFPPERVRFTLYQYTFTDRQTRATTGEWWTRYRVFSYPLFGYQEKR